MELELRHLTKTYHKINALNDFSEIMTPGIYGILGPNGAGKSTLMQIICRLLKQNSGEVLYEGKVIKNEDTEFQSKIGYVAQQQDLYENFTAEEFMGYISCLKKIDQKEAKIEIRDNLRLVELTEDKDRKIKEFSGGMKQRLLIAQALLGKPEILIFDEPTAGLDPAQRIYLRNYFATLSQDHILIISTHVVQDIESIANKIIFLQKGKIILEGSQEDILKRFPAKTYETMVNKKDLDYLNENCLVSEVEKNGQKFSVRFIYDKPIGLTPVVPKLEDVYLYYLGK